MRFGYLFIGSVLLMTIFFAHGLRTMSRTDSKSIGPQSKIAVADSGTVQISIEPTSRKRDAGGQKANESPPFKVGEQIKFDLIVMNSSINPVRVLTFDTYRQNRPQLFWGGDLLRYRDELEASLKASENEPGDGLRMDSVVLAPNESRRTETITLDHWYEPLKPGHYQLSLKHRFRRDDKWIESSSVGFEVTAKKD
jgi:hypothetical protein